MLTEKELINIYTTPKIKCKVLCTKTEDETVLEEFQKKEDVWLDAVVDLSKATGIKRNGHPNYSEHAVVYFESEIWTLDLSYEEVEKHFLSFI